MGSNRNRQFEKRFSVTRKATPVDVRSSVNTQETVHKTSYMDYETFPWPPLAHSSERPKWTEQGFDVGGIRRDILCYDQQASHWSPALTALHEAEAGRDHPMDIASRNLALTSLRRHVSVASPFVLEVGWSSGFFLESLQAGLPAARPIGSDYLPDPLHHLASRLPNLPIVQFDLTRCPLPDACVDAVVALNVLEHIENDEEALRQMRRILKPGGIAHIEVPSNPALYDVYDEQLLHHRRYRRKDLVARLRNAGFDVLRATHLGFLPYPLFAWVKRRSRKKLGWPVERKQAWLAAQIRETRRNVLLQLALSCELRFGSWISLPTGIRCVIAARRSI